ncbi:hypothetical protein ACWEHT_09455 [Streptomyces sp. NPDC004646]
MESQPEPDGRLVRVRQQVDAEVLRWRQGDILRNLYVLRLVDLSRPLSPETESEGIAGSIPVTTNVADPAELAILDAEVPLGFAIISQTCDVVREVANQPYIQLCPVIEVSDGLASSARKNESTRVVWLPGAGQNTCADLTRSFTAEKSVLIGHDPIHGVTTDAEIRNFAMTVARRFGRFAFPDDLTESMARMRKRFLDKRNKNSEEGFALRSIYQIRAEGFPSWDASEIEVTLHFILEPGILPDPDGQGDIRFDVPLRSPDIAARGMDGLVGEALVQAWVGLIRSWLSLCEPVGLIKSIDFQLVDTVSFSLEQVRSTEMLDLEYLSISSA